MLQTEHSFTLPLGYLDAEGNLHREGVMRLATAGDEILPLRDQRVQANEAYPEGDGDAELALLASATWGEDAPAHLLGDFAFALAAAGVPAGR